MYNFLKNAYKNYVTFSNFIKIHLLTKVHVIANASNS